MEGKEEGVMEGKARKQMRWKEGKKEERKSRR